MATPAIGTLAEFNPGEDQESYMEKFEFFCAANNITEEKKAAVFLTGVGTKTYDILRCRCTPKLLKQQTFEEIVILFKHLGSSNTLQRTLSESKAGEPTQLGQEDQANTNKPSIDSTQPQSQEKKGAMDEWEHALTHDELRALEEIGLGVAIDITSKHPWATKSAFQAKVVKKEELIVINESNKSHRSREQVETYTTIQQGLESSFRPDPTTPINVTVAADYHRSDTKSKTIDSQTVLTRTIAFRANNPLGSSRIEKQKETFEQNLHDWLVKKKCYPVICGEHDSKNCGLYSETTNHHCIDYLKELGGVTHYVSSITLGATKYHVTLNSTLFNSLSTSTEVSAHTFASASTKSKVSRKVFQSHSKEQHIGKLPAEGTDNILQFRTKGEAVVKCSYNSLANLVSHPQLRKLLEMGINEYIDLKKNGTRGPYHIGIAEVLPSNGSEGHEKRLYWKIDWNTPTSKNNQGKNKQKTDTSTSKNNQGENEQKTDPPKLGNRYNIVCTENKEEASNFYLKPVVQCSTHEKYFWIVTDPEDYDRHSLTGEPEASPIPESIPVSPSEPMTDKCIPKSKRKRRPQRHVSVCENNTLVVELNINRHLAKKSAFKLKNPRDSETYPLHKSQWLPEALCGSQPYLIGLEGKPFGPARRNDRVCSVYVKLEEKLVMFGKHEEGKDGYGFFILTTGHKT